MLFNFDLVVVGVVRGQPGGRLGNKYDVVEALVFKALKTVGFASAGSV